MSVLTHRAGFAALLVVGLAAAGALRWFPVGAADRGGEVQEIVLVARDMAFHRAGEPAMSNPALSLPAGGRVRLTLRNDEPGVTHNFSIPAWDVDSGTVLGPGEVHVEFVVPRTKGLEAYQCTPHATMMRGTIHVE